MNIAVYLPNWVGDVAMATPALRGLREGLSSETRIIGIGRPFCRDVLAGTDWLNELITPATNGGKRGFLSTFKTVMMLRQYEFGAAILLTNSFRTAAWALASGARKRVGYSRDLRAWMLTDVLQPRREGGRRVPYSTVESYLNLVRCFGVTPASRQLELATTFVEEDAADRVWGSLSWDSNTPVALFNTGGAFGPAKAWPSECFSELARRVAGELGSRVLILCGPAEREMARGIAKNADHPWVTSLADFPLSLGLSKACVRRSRLVVSTDSGPRHFAAAFGVPCVALFGPTHIAWSENFHAQEIRLQESVPCGPCQRRVCPLEHHRCMTELSVDRVFAATRELYERTSTSQAA